MSTSCDYKTTLKAIRKNRKKLKQIAILERVNRVLNTNEMIKIRKKYNIQEELQKHLLVYNDLYLTKEEKIDDDGSNCALLTPIPPEPEYEINKAEGEELNLKPGFQEIQEDKPILKSKVHQTTITDSKEGEDHGKYSVDIQRNGTGDDTGAATPKKEAKKTKTKHQSSFALSQFNVSTLKGHSEWITAVAIHKDVIVTASQDTTVKTWNLLTGEELNNFAGHRNSVTSLVVIEKPEGSKSELFQDEDVIVVSGSFDCMLKVWSMYSGQLLKSIYTYNAVTVVSYVPSHSLLAVGSDTGKLELWDLETSEQRFSLHAYDASITGIRVQEDYLYSSASDGMVKVHCITKDLQLSCVFESENVKSSKGSLITQRHIRSLELCNLGALVGDDARNIKLVNWRKNEATKIPNHHSDFSSTDSMRCHGDFLVSSSYDLDHGLGYLNVRRSHNLNYLGSLDDKDTERILCLDFHFLPSGNMVIVTGGSELKRWEILKKTRQTPNTEDVYQTEFRDVLADNPIDSDVEEESDDDDDDDDYRDEDSDEFESVSSRGNKQDIDSGSWMSWCVMI